LPSQGSPRRRRAPRGHAALRQALEFFEASEGQAGLLARGAGLLDLRERDLEAGARSADGCLEPRGVDLQKHLSAGDAVVGVDEHFGNDSRDFASDLYLVCRLEVAGRSDAHDELPDLDERGVIGGTGRHLGPGCGPVPDAQSDDREQHDRPDAATNPPSPCVLRKHHLQRRRLAARFCALFAHGFPAFERMGSDSADHPPPSALYN
jgi:hypothetical protein